MDSSSTPQFYQQSYPPSYPSSSSKPYSSTAAAAAAAAAAVGLPTPSLPPLSQLLPPASNTVRHTVLSHAQPQAASNTASSTPSSLSDPTTAAAVAAATVDHHLQYPSRQPYFAQPQVSAYEQPVVPSNIMPVFSTAAPTSTAHHLPSPPQSCTDGLSPAAVMAAQAAAAAAAASNTTHHPASIADPTASQKVFSFVPIPGVNHKKRPRRKYHEVERLYHCNYPGCNKAYGTLNHLNAHVSMQSHGAKRLPSEFKELRKQWRKQKREREASRQQQQENAAAAVAANTGQYHQHQAAAAAAAPPPPQPFLPSHSTTPSYLPWQHQQGYPGPPHQQPEFTDLSTLPGAPSF